jgi:hypothetical protein
MEYRVLLPSLLHPASVLTENDPSDSSCLCIILEPIGRDFISETALVRFFIREIFAYAFLSLLATSSV